MTLRVLISIIGAVGLLTSSASASPQIAQGIKDKLNKAISSGNLREFNTTLKQLPLADRQLVLKGLDAAKILGGKPVPHVEYPYYAYQVALITSTPSTTRSQFCGGTLIAPDVVVTAAHCVDNYIIRKRASRINIVAGTSDYTTDGERIVVSAIFIHPNWNASTLDYDVAVLKLKTGTRLGRPIDLEFLPIPVATRATVSGWGATVEDGPGSDDLLFADIDVLDSDTCNQPEHYDNGVTKAMICAGDWKGGIDACQGDSGGPLVAGPLTDRKLIGIVSWGAGCGRPENPGIYTRISEVAPWISSLGQVRIPTPLATAQ